MRNLDGDIEIRGWDRDEIEISAESEAGTAVWDEGAGRPRFDIEEGPERLTVRTRWDGDDRAVRPVRLILNVPRSLVIEEAATQVGGIRIMDLYGKIKASVLEGDLTVENFSGSLTASVGRGRIRAEILDLRPADEIRLDVREGDIRLDLEDAASAAVQAEASAGLASDWSSTAETKPVRIKIGAGEAKVALRAENGRIELRKAVKTA